jgi:hypothetical protein
MSQATAPHIAIIAKGCEVWLSICAGSLIVEPMKLGDVQPRIVDGESVVETTDIAICVWIYELWTSGSVGIMQSAGERRRSWKGNVVPFDPRWA